MPGLIWNMMMSMSGGWFFVVASEAISVGDTTINLPGIGSYLALAIEQKRIDAVVAAIVAMLVVIIAYDQLLFRPLVAFGSRLPRRTVRRARARSAPGSCSCSAARDWLRALIGAPAARLPERSRCCVSNLPLRGELRRAAKPLEGPNPRSHLVAFGGAAAICALWLRRADFVSAELTLGDIRAGASAARS